LKTRYLFFATAVLFAVGVLLMVFYQQPLTPPVAAKEISIRLTEQLNKLDQEVEQYSSSWVSCQEVNASYPIFIYKNKGLFCWTDNKLMPPLNLISDSTSVQLLKIAQSNFLLYQKPLAKDVQLVALIMLTRKYPIQNDFLTSEWRSDLFPTNTITILEPLSNLGVPVNYNEQTLFRISFLLRGLSANPTLSVWSFAFIMIGLVLLIISVDRTLKERVSNEYHTVSMCVLLLVLRIVMILGSYPRSFFTNALFSPTEFASSWFNPSLGDLWLNVVMLLIIAIYIFRFANARLTHKKESKLSPSMVILCVILSFLLFGMAHYPILTLQTITHNSNLDFSITSSLDFPGTRLLSLSALLITWATAFLLIHVLLKFILYQGAKHTHRMLLAGALLFALVNYWEGQPFITTLLTTWCIILLIHYFDFLSSLTKIQYKTFNYLFIVLLGFVINCTATIYFLNQERNRSNQLRFAESYLADRDTFGEFLLNDLSTNIDKDVFIQTRFASPFLSKVPIQQKIRQVYLPSYFNKYDVRILLFNSQGAGIGEVGAQPFAEFISQVEQEANKTQFEGLYRIGKRKRNVAQQYVLVRPVQRNGFLNGYIIVELSLKKSIPDNVYPELLVDNRFRESLRPSNLSYATFVRGEVESQAGNFDYEAKFDARLLGDEALYKQGLEWNGFQHIAVEDVNQVVTVISTSTMSVKHILTNASFYLILGLMLVLFIIVGYGISNFLTGRQLYYSARIQLLINLSFFIPLVIICIVTLRMLSESSQEQLNATYLDRVSFLSEQLSAMKDSKDSTGNVQREESMLQELSRGSNSELFLYDKNGLLQYSSHNALFENQLMAPLANALALPKMRAGEHGFIIPEQIGGLSFFVAFAKLPNLSSYLAIPYYQSASTVQRLQVEALADILVIFVFVFLILLVFSFFVARWLTFPLEMISASMQRTSLQQPNEPLRWNSNDEIGLMVQSYNGMLQKLKENMVVVERMQREQAWRDIAQQVAHEIKNPLTPMKLTLQRLTRNIQENEFKHEQLVNSLSSMLEQVEVLNSIASSFSTFAKLPTAKIERIDLRTILFSVCEVYEQSPVNTITCPPTMPALGDALIVKTIFSNIIINAIQAKQEDRELELKIMGEQVNGYWRILFIDNGKGIDAEKADKLFLPHFTTKETGSGLGLAIAKRGVEQMSGSISFESVLHKGSTFIIMLPIADQDISL